MTAYGRSVGVGTWVEPNQRWLRRVYWTEPDRGGSVSGELTAKLGDLVGVGLGKGQGQSKKGRGIGTWPECRAWA